MSIVGRLTWDDCEECEHYRPDEGGCKPVDQDSVQLTIDIEYDQVMCETFKQRSD